MNMAILTVRVHVYTAHAPATCVLLVQRRCSKHGIVQETGELLLYSLSINIVSLVFALVISVTLGNHVGTTKKMCQKVRQNLSQRVRLKFKNFLWGGGGGNAPRPLKIAVVKV